MENIDIFIVSMLHDSERREKIEENCVKFNLRSSFIDAVNGREILAKDYYPLAKNPNFLFNRRHIISPAELGCRLSHKKAIETFLADSKKEWLVVFEDDIKFDISLVNYLNKINSIKSNNEYVIHLGGQDGLSTKRRIIFKKDNMYDLLKAKTVFSFTLRWLYRTCGYLINRSAAKELMKVHQFSFVADDWCFVKNKSKIDKIYYVDLIKHPIDLSNSSIEHERK